MWLRCRFLDTEIDVLNPGTISMLHPRAKHIISIVSVDLAVKKVTSGNSLVKGVCSVL